MSVDAAGIVRLGQFKEEQEILSNVVDRASSGGDLLDDQLG